MATMLFEAAVSNSLSFMGDMLLNPDTGVLTQGENSPFALASDIPLPSNQGLYGTLKREGVIGLRSEGVFWEETWHSLGVYSGKLANGCADAIERALGEVNTSKGTAIWTTVAQYYPNYASIVHYGGPAEDKRTIGAKTIIAPGAYRKGYVGGVTEIAARPYYDIVTMPTTEIFESLIITAFHSVWIAGKRFGKQDLENQQLFNIKVTDGNYQSNVAMEIASGSSSDFEATTNYRFYRALPGVEMEFTDFMRRTTYETRRTGRALKQQWTTKAVITDSTGWEEW